MRVSNRRCRETVTYSLSRGTFSRYTRYMSIISDIGVSVVLRVAWLSPLAARDICAQCGIELSSVVSLALYIDVSHCSQLVIMMPRL